MAQAMCLSPNAATAKVYVQVAAEDRAVHVPWDLNYHAKGNRGAALLQALGPLCLSALDASHIFVHRPDDKVLSHPQSWIHIV